MASDDWEILTRKVLNKLRDATNDGYTLKSLLNDICPAPSRFTKDRVRDFLKDYAIRHPDDIYCWLPITKGSNGRREKLKIWPGKEEFKKVKKGERDKITQGASISWKLAARPKILDEDIKALTLALTVQFSKCFLPPDEREVVEGLCENALVKAHDQVAWLKHIDIVPRYPPLFPKYDIDEYAYKEQVVIKALKNRAGFRASYLKGELKTFFPVRLVRREWVSYILCTEDSDKQSYKEMAIHRFEIEKVDDVELIDRPHSHNVDYYKSMITPSVTGNWGELKLLALEVTGPPAQHLSEMRFHETPEDDHLTTISNALLDDDGRLESVTIEVKNLNYNYEFKTWLLGLGRYVYVKKAIPAEKNSRVDVKGDLRKEIEGMQKLY